jgi:flagellar L-ring protein precursor FlgH
MSLAACGNMMTRLSQVGDGPQLSRIENPTQQKGYQPISMPMPAPVPPPRNPNSLWRTGARAFFKDQRASKVGDILTVNLSIADSATFDTTFSRSRSNTDSANATNLLGFEGSLSKILPKSVDPANLLNVGSTGTSKNAGATGRSETLTSNIAATIIQVLPNGNLVISGSQEIRVNYEMRQLTIQGIVRPEDISTDNTVTYDKIADLRVYYGGEGVASDFTQPSYGQEILDILFPF